jgi:hypothetical protein
MSTYQITKSDGSFLTMIEDRETDSSTSLTLFGQGFNDYGSDLDQNFVYLLENFANIIAPSNPLVGQLWYDLTNSKLNYYDSSLVWIPIINGNDLTFTGDLILYDGLGDESELTNNGILILTNTNTPKIEMERVIGGPVISTIQLNGTSLEITSQLIVDGGILSDSYLFESNTNTGIVNVSDSVGIQVNGSSIAQFTSSGLNFNTGLIEQYNSNAINVNAVGGLYINGNLVYDSGNFTVGNFLPLSGGTMTGPILSTAVNGLILNNVYSVTHLNDSITYNIVLSNANPSNLTNYNSLRPFGITLATGDVQIGTNLLVDNELQIGSSDCYFVQNSSNLLAFALQGADRFQVDSGGNVYACEGDFILGYSGGSSNCGLTSGGNGAVAIFISSGTTTFEPMVFSDASVVANVDIYAPAFVLTNGATIQPSNSNGGLTFTSSGTYVGSLQNNGNLTVTGDITAYSDERLKSNIKTSKGLNNYAEQHIKKMKN